MPKFRLFIWALSHEDEILFKIKFDEHHRPQQASINMRSRIDGSWHQVCRYDNAHGPPHVHRYWRVPQVSQLPAIGTNELITLAKADLKTNWQAHRKAMEESLRA